MNRLTISAASFLTAVLGGITLISCDIQSGNDFVRNTSIQLAGTYRNENGIPSRQSGARTTRITLTQSGDQLFGVDEHNIRWSGKITRAESAAFATVNIKGGTTAGGEVTLTGEVRVEGTLARMTGIWIEPGYTSNFSAEATVTPAPAPTPTPQPGPGPTPTPTPAPTNGGTNGPTLIIGPSPPPPPTP